METMMTSEPFPKRQATVQDHQVVESLVKFCVPSNLVGSVIGKGGENVNEFMRQSDTKIHMSKAHEMFPGTRDRICTIHGGAYGGMQNVLIALHLILSKLQAEDSFKSFQFNLVMPAQGCGAIIGRGGVNIKAIMEDTGSQVKVSDLNQMPAGLPFRLLTISGSIEQQIRTVALSVQKASDETDYVRNLRGFHGVAPSLGSPMDGVYGGYDQHHQHHQPMHGHSPHYMGGMQHHQHQQHHQNQHQHQHQHQHGLTSAEYSPFAEVPQISACMTTTCVMKLPDEYVGCIIGKAGSVINNVKKVTGCHIKVSEKNAAADSSAAAGGSGGGGGEPSGIPSGADQLPQTMIEGGNNSNNPLASEDQQQQQLRSVVITGQESMVVRAYNMFFEQLSLNVYNRNR